MLLCPKNGAHFSLLNVRRERKRQKEAGEAVEHRKVTATMDWGATEDWHSRPATPEATGAGDGGGGGGGGHEALSASWSDSSDPGADDDGAGRQKTHRPRPSFQDNGGAGNGARQHRQSATPPC